MSLMSDAAWQICQDHGGVWGNHPEFPTEDWTDDVINGQTRRGYWNWVAAKLEEFDEE